MNELSDTLLTTREHEVLQLLSRGLGDREIADTLVLTVGTVKWYNRQIYNKLEVRNRTEAVTKAQLLGLLGDDSATSNPPHLPQHHLPAQLTSFIGRKGEIEELSHLVMQSRLVTLTGPPGTGKTRLAIEVAIRLSSAFRDGVYFVSLAPLRKPEFVAHSIAQALDVNISSMGSILDLLKTHLRHRKLLLVLDNFEHLLPAAPDIAELLAAAAHLTVIATSREALSLYGEHAFPVPPLQTPDLRRLPAPDVLRSHEAVELFVQRAQAAVPDFEFEASNAGAVATICTHLDGLPLAIELAASRIKFYAPETLLVHLGSRLEALGEGPRDLPSRQRTLRSTLAWSYDLLDDAEQLLFARVGVFVGGGTLEDIQAVCSDGPDVSTDVESLLSKSLLQREKGRDRQPHFMMLETMREYALEKLAESGETELMLERHARYFSEMAARTVQYSPGPDEPRWLNHLDTQHDNLRAALQWTLTHDPTAQMSFRLIADLSRFWHLKCYLHEGRDWFVQAAALPGADMPTKARADALLGTGDLAYTQSDYDAAQEFYAEALDIYRELNDLPGTAHALLGLGEVDTEVGDYVSAPQRFAEAYDLMQRLDDQRGCAAALTQLGWCALRIGDLEQARVQLQEGRALYEAVDDKVGIGLTCSGLGEVAVRSGEFEEAAALLEESLRLRRELGQKWGIAVSLGSLGWIAIHERNFDHATQLLQESLLIRQEIGDRGGFAWCLERLADIAYLQQNPARAVRILGAAAAVRTSVNSVIDPVDQTAYQNTIERLQQELGEEAFHMAWTEGEAAPATQVMDYIFVEEDD